MSIKFSAEAPAWRRTLGALPRQNAHSPPSVVYIWWHTFQAFNWFLVRVVLGAGESLILFDFEEGDTEESEEEFKADDVRCNCSTSFTLSMGAVIVREKIPAMAPAMAFRNASLEVLVAAGVFAFVFAFVFDEEIGGLVARTVIDWCTFIGGTGLWSFDRDSRRDGTISGYLSWIPWFAMGRFFSSVRFHSGLGRFIFPVAFTRTILGYY
mmetsp:Transcript_21665/g.45566  ORF Transcript_21665/g.45566 Transcript_21665/m.45566 type:complete len:210 (+) Transcript_21665:853-1482(+)